jgi:hypothetical protein
MSALSRLLRQFSIRTRMRGAIAMVLVLFALVGGAGIAGGLALKHLNAEFMDHSIKELMQVGDITRALDTMRLAERDMVIGYEDNNRNHAANRKSWEQQLADARQSLNRLLDGEEDEDNVVAREVLKLLDAYATSKAWKATPMTPAGPPSAPCAIPWRNPARRAKV